MRQGLAVPAGIVVVMAMAEPCLAVPAFAQRYGVECHMCHQGFPYLNRTGQKFKEHGFRLEQEGPFKISDWIRSIPLRARAAAESDFAEGQDATRSLFVKLIAAGNLGSRLSYWADSGLLFDSFDDTKVYREPTDAWLRVDLLSSARLYARVGRFELDLPFTQARSPHLFPYAIYAANTGLESDSIALYREGAELGGVWGDETYHWSAAFTGGGRQKAAEVVFGKTPVADAGDDFEGNVFLRLSRRGDRTRFGAFSYVGRNTLEGRGKVSRWTWPDRLLRIGADADVWITSKIDLYGLALYGRNADSLPAPTGDGGRGEVGTLYGGFVQADYHVVEKAMDGFLKDLTVIVALRGNLVRSGVGTHETESSLYPGLHVWIRERCRVGFEYGFEGQGRPDVGRLQGELVF
jgi:hypothetical protein